MTSFDRATGRDRYFAAKERELDALLDPETGIATCPICGAARQVGRGALSLPC